MRSDPRLISIEEYKYELPDDKIARYPLAKRDDSKLLYWNKGEISDRQFRELPHLIPLSSTLVFNNTRVFEARLFFKNSSGATIEIFLLEPVDGNDPVKVMSSHTSCIWKCFVGRAAKWKEPTLTLQHHSISLTAELLQREQGAFIIQFKWTPEETIFATLLHELGVMPVPPYLRRESEKIDTERYQTVYAEKEGSVAAPTAGLHFTEEIQEQLKQDGIQCLYVTLHVGAGTFKPVTSETMSGHEMHAEMITVTQEFLRQLTRLNPPHIIAVGTTSLRTLESLFWLGVDLLKNNSTINSSTEIDQWAPYENSTNEISFHESIQAVMTYASVHDLNSITFRSRLLIVPGYLPISCGGLITNFHQPSSTLLLIIAAITENKWKKIYDHALFSDYRFLSYGDSSYLQFK